MAETRTAVEITADLKARLRDRYRTSEWALLFEVANGTGARSSRSCDALSMSLWPSKGLHLHGHEIKATRSDWQREIQDPSKAEAFAKRCHYWWIVAAPKVVNLEELPERWGLMEAVGKGLKVRRPASIREPEAVSFQFLAAVMRRVCEQGVDAELIAAAREQGRKEGRASAGDGRSLTLAKRELESLRATVTEFESASGIRITSWDAPRVGEDFRAFSQIRRTCGLESRADGLERLAEQLALAATALREASGVLDG